MLGTTQDFLLPPFLIPSFLEQVFAEHLPGVADLEYKDKRGYLTFSKYQNQD